MKKDPLQKQTKFFYLTNQFEECKGNYTYHHRKMMDVLSEFNEHVGYFGVYMGKNITFNDLLTSLYTLSVSDFTMNISSKTEFDNKDAEFVNKFIKDKIRTVIQRMVHLMDLYIRELKSSINQEQMDKFELNVWFDEAQHTFTTVKPPSNS